MQHIECYIGNLYKIWYCAVHLALNSQSGRVVKHKQVWYLSLCPSPCILGHTVDATEWQTDYCSVGHCNDIGLSSLATLHAKLENAESAKLFWVSRDSEEAQRALICQVSTSLADNIPASETNLRTIMQILTAQRGSLTCHFILQMCLAGHSCHKKSNKHRSFKLHSVCPFKYNEAQDCHSNSCKAQQ